MHTLSVSFVSRFSVAVVTLHRKNHSFQPNTHLLSSFFIYHRETYLHFPPGSIDREVVHTMETFITRGSPEATVDLGNARARRTTPLLRI